MVTKTSEKTAEEVGEDVFNELINESFIIPQIWESFFQDKQFYRAPLDSKNADLGWKRTSLF